MLALAVAHALIIGTLAALLVQTVLNLRALPRLGRRPSPAPPARVAVLIPARDEAERIGD